VSMDSVAEQKKFSDDRGAFFPLLSDPEGRILRAFGVGLDRKGRPLRETFLLENGRIVWHDPTSSTRRLARDVLDAIDGYPPPPPQIQPDN
ncbi:MAG: peroxiredoxin family protein, partial [Akkermansiaceae bacterium]|nr:peroxiredoxin family protein [Akkermansiaceae bacterium]